MRKQQTSVCVIGPVNLHRHKMNTECAFDKIYDMIKKANS